MIFMPEEMPALYAGLPMLVVSAIAVGVAMLVNAGGPLEAFIQRVAVFATVVVACGAMLVWSMRAAYFGPATGPGRHSEANTVPPGRKRSVILRAKP